jgi:rhamnose utilization protein RhaD (predicted bifunctional aldolase and dehydrogenase)
LITLSRSLGKPEKDYVIVAEGNTSARIDHATFWVKASGSRLHKIDAKGFVQMSLDGVLEMLKGDDLSDAETKQKLGAARVNANATAWPSLETPLHALALSLGGAEYVGHTHPTAVNVVLCSQKAAEAIQGRLFPDEITNCGLAPAFVPYADPGIPLMRQAHEVLSRYLDEYGEPPKTILLQNHGLMALGKTPAEVENITAMCVKAFRILVGTWSLGGPHLLTSSQVQRIYTRPDEEIRRQKTAQ